MKFTRATDKLNTPQKGGNGGNPQSKLPGLPTSKGVFADGKDEGKNQDNPTKSYVQNENKSETVEVRNYPFKENPRNAIFEVVKWESPKNKYGSLSVKALYDMIPEPSLSMKAIYGICEELYNIGAFTKTPGGSYRINPEFKDGDL